MSQGKLIVLEGMVGCGKSTQLNYITERFKEKNLAFFYGREPGGVEISEEIRKVLLDSKYKGVMIPATEVFLFQAARAQFYHDLVKPKINEGVIFVTDRSYWSTVAFQGYGRGFAIDRIKAYNEDAVDGLHPDLTFIFDVDDVKISALRARAKSTALGPPDRFEHEELDFHTRVRDGYRSIAQDHAGKVILVPSFEEESNIPQRITEIKEYVSDKLDVFDKK